MEDITTSPNYIVYGQTLSIKQPISCAYEPCPDITSFELATLLPYLFGRLMYQEDWGKLGEATRHLKRL